MNDEIPAEMKKAVNKLKRIIGGQEIEIRSIPPINISAYDIIEMTGQFDRGTVEGLFKPTEGKPVYRINVTGGSNEND